MKYILDSYHHSYDYILNLLELMENDEIVAIVASTAYIECLKNDSRIVKNNIQIVKDIEEYLGDYDGILLLSNQHITITNKTEENLKLQSKKIISFETQNYLSKKESLSAINVPIVTISKADERICSVDFCLQLTSMFKHNNHRTMLVSDNAIIKLFGYEPFEKRLFEDIDIRKKIKELNYWINKRIVEEKPDVLIIDIPKSINDEYLYIIQHAVPGDYNILLTEAMWCFNNYFNIAKKAYESLYLGSINEIVISNQLLDFLEEGLLFGIPISEQSLFELAEGNTTVFDLVKIYSNIEKHFKDWNII